MQEEEFDEEPCRLWLDKFLNEAGFIDTFRWFHRSQKKAFTCWNTQQDARMNNFGTRIDYILADGSLIKYFRNSQILSDVFGSDHCPVKGFLDLNFVQVPGPTSLPSLCTKFYPEFSGKQMLMKNFLQQKHNSMRHLVEPRRVKKKQTVMTKFLSSEVLLKDHIPVDEVPILGQHPTMHEKQLKDQGDQQESLPTINRTSSVIASQWKDLLKGKRKPPLCSKHAQPCSLKTVRKKGPNQGRQFWSCSRGIGHPNDVEARCDFFRWLSDCSD